MVLYRLRSLFYFGNSSNSPFRLWQVIWLDNQIKLLSGYCGKLFSVWGRVSGGCCSLHVQYNWMELWWVDYGYIRSSGPEEKEKGYFEHKEVSQ